MLFSKTFTNVELMKRVFENQDTLMNFNKLMLDTAYGRTEGLGISKEQANSKIRAKFAEVLGVPVGTRGKELRRAIRANKTAIFEIIEDTIEDLLVSGWGDNPFFQRYVDIRNIAQGDLNEFYMEDDSLLTVSEIASGHNNLIRQRYGVGQAFQIPTSIYGIKIYEEYERFQLGKVDWAAFCNKIYEAVDRFVNDTVYKSFMDASKVLPTDMVKESALTADTLDDFFSLVEEVETTTGKSVTVFGTRAALNHLMKLIDPAWATDAMKEQRASTGIITNYEGLNLAVIPQVYEINTRNKMIDNKTLLIMPTDGVQPIKVVNEGQAEIIEVTDGVTNRDRTIEYQYTFRMGVGVVINMLYGVWKIA